jgi:hypothetical protein
VIFLCVKALGSSTDLEQDKRILDITKELCQQLNISNYNPRVVSWTSVMPRGRNRFVEIPFDECILTKMQIILPAAMKDRLEADEWKPILASELFFSRRARKTYLVGIALRAIPFFLLAAALFFLLPQALPQPITATSHGLTTTAPLGSRIFPFIAFPLVAFGTAFLAVRYSKKVRLEADRASANIVGTASFLGVLNKIAAVAGPGGRSKRRFGGPVPFLPSIEERIANLQSYSERSGSS